jgi:small subunit ribosomal protein S20
LANIKSAIKRIRSSKRRAARNKAARTRAKSTVKDVRTLIDSGADSKETAAAINAAASTLDKADSKGILHKRNAARRKSRLMKAATKAAKK